MQDGNRIVVVGSEEGVRCVCMCVYVSATAFA